jgi:hypothetical protein
MQASRLNIFALFIKLRSIATKNANPDQAVALL